MNSTVGDTKRRVRLLIGAAAIALCSGSLAHAQASADKASPAAVSEVVVTGSQIHGVAAVGSTTIGVSHDEIAAMPAITTGDLFLNVPQVINLGVGETHRGVQGGAGNITYGTGVNLRGIGPQSTLVLLDGHRVSRSGTAGGFIDPSAIPTLALERAEIVADGASATYGSDAVAGVLNLILRRNLDGVEAQARYGVADSYRTTEAGVAAGKVWDGGQVMIAYEYSYHTRLKGEDRDFFKSDLRSFGGNDFRNGQCVPANILVGTTTYSVPSLTVGAARCEVSAFGDMIPEQKKHNLALTFSQDLGDNIRIYGDAYAYKRDYSLITPTANQSSSVPRTNAFFIAAPGLTAASETVQFSFARDVGPRFGYNFGFAKAYQGTVGAEFKLPHEWRFNVLATAGRDDESSTGGGVNPALLTSGLASSNPATAINPFGVGQQTNPAVIAALFDFISLRAKGKNTQVQGQAKLDGPLFDLPGGTVRMAAGLEYEYTGLMSGTDQGPTSALTSVRVYPTRKVKSGFVEFLIPLVGSGNAMPLVKALTLDLAGRIDDYNDVGRTSNPKVGVTWDVTDDLRVRGSWGTSFRAPALTNIKSVNPTLTVGTLVDPKSPTGFSTGYSRSDDNPNLKPEEAATYSVGADWTPAAMPGLKLSGTYFSIDIKGQIAGYLGDATLLQRESVFSSLIIRNPSPAILDPLLSTLIIRGVRPAVADFLIDGRAQNLGTVLAKGFDFVGRYQWSTAAMGDFGVGLSGSYFTKFDVAQTASAPVLDRRSFINYPIKYRLRGNVNWRKDGLSSAVYLNYQPSYSNDTVTPIQMVKGQATVDLYLAYDLKDRGTWLQGTTVSLNVQNLFDKDPPFFNGNGGFDPQNYSPIGRLVTFGIDKKW